MKKIFVFALLALALLGCAALGSIRENRAIADGVYEGTGRGYRGPIQVQVLVEGGVIAGIEIISSDEDPSVGGAAMEDLLDLVLEYNTVNVDVISGATESSKGFLDAVENAILRNE